MVPYIIYARGKPSGPIHMFLVYSDLYAQARSRSTTFRNTRIRFSELVLPGLIRKSIKCRCVCLWSALWPAKLLVYTTASKSHLDWAVQACLLSERQPADGSLGFGQFQQPADLTHSPEPTQRGNCLRASIVKAVALSGKKFEPQMVSMLEFSEPIAFISRGQSIQLVISFRKYRGSIWVTLLQLLRTSSLYVIGFCLSCDVTQESLFRNEI